MVLHNNLGKQGSPQFNNDPVPDELTKARNAPRRKSVILSFVSSKHDGNLSGLDFIKEIWMTASQLLEALCA